MFLVSYDVTSLFTNIPLSETIDLAVNAIFDSNTESDLKLSKIQLKELFNFATSHTHFLFNGCFYDQIDGVAMGSPLALVLANFFMGHYEKLWLDNYTGPRVLYYRRYVDDIICCFRNSEHAIMFFEYLNMCHPNIKFTMETEEKGHLPFLDVLLSKQSTSDNQCSCVTSVFRKKTYTGLLTNYFSFTPFKYKLGLIKTLIDRAYKINNTTQGFQNDIKNLSVILKRNLFPEWLIDKSVKGYLRKVKTTEQDVDTSTSDNSNCHFYKLPYIGFYSTYTGKKISSIINKYCKDLNVKVIFSPFKLSSMFSPKDFIPESLKSRVVYQFTCASCGARYIGETNRHFHTRVNEHLFRDKNSHVFKHLNCSRHCRDSCDASSFKIIDSAKTFSQLKIKESFHIERSNPELNKQVEHVNLTLHF